MLPRELIDRYGAPIVRTVTLSAGVHTIVGHSNDRWFLALWGAALSGGIRPVVSDGSIPELLFANDAGPCFRLHIQTHGLLTTLAWETEPLFGGGLITITECFARPTDIGIISRESPTISVAKKRAKTPWSDYYRRLRQR